MPRPHREESACCWRWGWRRQQRNKTTASNSRSYWCLTSSLQKAMYREFEGSPLEFGGMRWQTSIECHCWISGNMIGLLCIWIRVIKSCCCNGFCSFCESGTNPLLPIYRPFSVAILGSDTMRILCYLPISSILLKVQVDKTPMA